MDGLNYVMEVLLLQNVAKLGKKDDLLVVGDGFALNYLLPTRQAIVATPLVRRRYAERIRSRAEEREVEKSSQEGAAKALSGKVLKFKKKVTKTGKLYAAISEKVLSEALRDQHKMDILAADIEIGQPIKSVGKSEIMVRMGGQKLPVSVVVEAEAGE